MLITLTDGNYVRAVNVTDRTAAFLEYPIRLKEHSMRLHIVDQGSNTARRKFVCDNPELIEAISSIARRFVGPYYHSSSWTHIKIHPSEFADPSDYAGMNLTRMVTRDLESYWGDKVELTGIAVRDLRYTSDGSMGTTPEAIGKFNSQPLIYAGRAVGVTFNLVGQDVLRDGRNVVYWLPKPWWDKFHSQFRHKPKPFPWPTGFICSNWCQRDGHAKYRDGIYLASMTQGQTVGSWSATSLMNYLDSNWGGVSIRAQLGQVKVPISVNNPAETNAMEASVTLYTAIEALGAYAKLGYIGAVCIHCGNNLTNLYAICSQCGKSVSHWKLAGRRLCAACGRFEANCGCEHPRIVTPTEGDLITHHKTIAAKIKAIYKMQQPPQDTPGF